MITSKPALFLTVYLGAISPAAADWAVTKIITIHHLGAPAENDGWRPETFFFEISGHHRSAWALGLVENSEGGRSPLIGYRRVFSRRGALDLTGALYVAGNYRTSPKIRPIPTFGIRYHLNKRVSLLAETMPVPKKHDSYLMVMTGISVNF